MIYLEFSHPARAKDGISLNPLSRALLSEGLRVSYFVHLVIQMPSCSHALQLMFPQLTRPTHATDTHTHTHTRRFGYRWTRTHKPTESSLCHFRLSRHAVSELSISQLWLSVKHHNNLRFFNYICNYIVSFFIRLHLCWHAVKLMTLFLLGQ